MPSRGAVAIGPSESTTTSIVTALPTPPPEGFPITIGVAVSAASSPTHGHVSILGAPGGACSDLTLAALDATRAQAECSIAWNSPGTRTLRAHSIGASDGAITWTGSMSPEFTVEVIAERLLVDGFEPSP